MATKISEELKTQATELVSKFGLAPSTVADMLLSSDGIDQVRAAHCAFADMLVSDVLW